MATPNADLLAAVQADRNRNPLRRSAIHGMAPTVIADEVISDIHTLLQVAGEAMEALVLPDTAEHAGKRSRRWEVLNVPVNNVLSKFNAAAWRIVIRNATRHAIENLATGQPGEWGVLRYAAGFEQRDYRMVQDEITDNETRQRANGDPTVAITRVKRETHIQVVAELVDTGNNDDIIYELGKPRRTDGMDGRVVEAMRAAFGQDKATSPSDAKMAALEAQVALLTQLLTGQTVPAAVKAAAQAVAQPSPARVSAHDLPDDESDEADDDWDEADAILAAEYDQATRGDAELLQVKTPAAEPVPFDPTAAGPAATYENERRRLDLLGKRELNDEYKAVYDQTGRGMAVDEIKDALLTRRFELEHALAQAPDAE